MFQESACSVRNGTGRFPEQARRVRAHRTAYRVQEISRPEIFLAVPGQLYARLFEVAAGRYGYLTADDAHDLGVPVTRLNTMVARETLVHVSRGVYRFPLFPSGPLDQYFEMTV